MDLNDKLDLNLEIKKIQKTASLGNLPDVKEESEMAKYAAMTKEMLDLPKYDPIISKLRSASGVVNFVTDNEYAPLVELLLKKAFPRSNNDVFTMGLGDVGDEFFISPRYLDSKKTEESVAKLSNLLLGTEVVVTRTYMKNVMHAKDEDILAILGPVATMEQLMEAQGGRGGGGPALNPRGVASDQYEAGIKEVNDRYNGIIKKLDSEIFKVRMSESKEKKLSQEDLAKLIDQRALYISLRKKDSEEVFHQFGAGITYDKVFGSVKRNDDGFVNFNPKSNIEEAAYELMKVVASQSAAAKSGERKISTSPSASELGQDKFRENVLNAAFNLTEKLRNFYTNDPKLKKIKEAFIEFLGNGGPEDFKRIVDNIGSMHLILSNAFKSKVIRHDKIMIIDDMDRTTMCNRNHQDGKIRLPDQAAGIFSDFIGRNHTNNELDRSTSKKEKGNRAVIVISSEPIANLPSNSVISMDVAPVNKDEAKIIVTNMLKMYSGELMKISERRMRKEIDKKFGSDPKKVFEINKIREKLSVIGQISDETIKRMISRIIGLSQKDAIDAARVGVESGMQWDDDDPINPDISFDEEKALTMLTQEVNQKWKSDVAGLRTDEAEVKFDEYAYKKASAWAGRVRCVKKTSDALFDYDAAIKTLGADVRKIDEAIKISSKVPAGHPEKLSLDDVNAKLARRQALMNQIAYNTVERNKESALNLPHVYLLYGGPGVGKTIWAHALADLRKLQIVYVDLGAQKNMWLGNTEKSVRKLFAFMGEAKQTLFLIDEIDRQVSMGENANSPAVHETTRDIVNKFLDFFDNTANNKKFVDNDIYFVMTTNNVNGIEGPLKGRVAETHQVELPEDPEDYKKFFMSHLRVEYQRFPDRPWVCDEGSVATGLKDVAPSTSDIDRIKKTNDICWQSTFKFINSLDWDKISVAFAGKHVDFRTLKLQLQLMFNYDQSYRQTLRQIAQGKPVDLDGIPLTTENLIALAGIMGDTNEAGQRLGVGDLVTKRVESVKKILAPYVAGQKKLESYTYKDPFTQEEKTGYKFPQEVEKILDGATEATEEIGASASDWEYEQEVDPSTGLSKKKLKKKKTPQQEMEDLGRGGFKESPLVETTPEKVSPEVKTSPSPEQKDVPSEEQTKEKGTEKEKEKEKGKDKSKQKEEKPVLSSTDYYFGFLKKQGLISEDGKILMANANPIPVAQPAKIEKNIKKTDDEKEVGGGEGEFTEGIYNYGFVLIAPGYADAPPQSL